MKLKNKAQALVEFLILIPVLIIFLTGILQFAKIFTVKIKLAILEREIMMYLVSDVDKEEDVDKFIKNYSKILGLEYDDLKVEYNSGFGSSLKNNFLLNFFNKFISIRVNIYYKEKLIPSFNLLTGKEYIVLKTDLHTAHGGSFNLSYDNIMNNLAEFFKKQMGTEYEEK